MKKVWILLILLGTLSSAGAQTTVEEWQRKVVADFPQIGVSGSELNKKYVQTVQLKKTEDPGLFNNPKWPYLLAQFVTAPAIIPGLDPTTGTPQAGESSKTKLVTVPGMGKVEIVPANEVSAKGVAGQMICLQGIVSKSQTDTTGSQPQFIVKIQPDLICTFSTAPFFTRNTQSLHRFGLMPGLAPSYKLKFDDSSVAIYGPRRFNDNAPVMKIGEIFKPGEMVKIYGRYDGPGSVGVEKGTIVRDCAIMPVL